jgi:pilus assembly protein CpaF
MANLDIPSAFIRKFISSAIDIVIHTERFADGRRKLVSLQEITGMEGDVITLQEIFSFKKTGIGLDGRVEGRFVFHGVRPRFLDRFLVAGIPVPQDLFGPTAQEG